ncbi:hypothetical protein GETHOR_24200 [Geothrix oryzae]|uniref:Acyltransferase n=1 Tax=Geothrix oryzae TaxID=2927975 RepID=A0ABM8DTC6_9BACT|nr:acyltransferase family protein [Geothrix oryzae]BDU70319.1 hypothetical protein GETHOR_24200 [Geothrix oryzae]
MIDQEVLHSPTLNYRPAIDGLRALAILSVFFFHLNRRWLPGGFVGVDVFFVISGYLITSLLLKDRMRDSLSLATFYQRRIARIFPAFFLVGLATLAGAAAIYSPHDLASTGAGLTAAALSVVNLKLIFQGNYFTLSQDAQPFLHYWSLSVEEQFYLFFPLLLVLTAKWNRERLLRGFWVLWVMTFITCLALTYARPAWAFYLLPTRAWELLTGAILATASIGTARQQGSGVDRALPFVGLGLVGLSFLIVPEDRTFPGAWALLPVLGTAAVIRPPAEGGNLVERWLAAAPLVIVGQMSYSLYLWHWPIFSMVDYQFFTAGEHFRLALKLALTIPIAYLSFRYIEGPARRYFSAPGKMRPTLAFLVTALVICVPLGVWARETRYIDMSTRVVARGGRSFGDPAGAVKVVLMGDSQGSMYARVVKEICEEVHYHLTVVSVSSGDPLPKADAVPAPLWDDSLSVIRRIRPDVLLVACEWRGKLNGAPERLTMAIKEVSPFVGRVVLIDQPPILPPDANRGSIREGARWPFHEETSVREGRLASNRQLVSLKSDRCLIVETASKFEAPDGSLRFWDGAGRETYDDAMHLSYYGANLVRGDLELLIRMPGWAGSAQK